MHYGLRFFIDKSVDTWPSYWIHGRDLPGYPASHGCIGLYDEEMQLWTRSVELFPLRSHLVRYERLVEDAEAELRPLASFLGLEWLAGLLDHRATARQRAFIKTPGYSQVTEPVNARAVGRWTRYREQLEPVLPILEPWAGRMGYEI